MEWPEIRQLPEVDQRVESGPIQFGDDWPGTFIRGDHGMGHVLALDLAIAALESSPPRGEDWPVNWPLIVYGLKNLRNEILSANLVARKESPQ